MIPPAGIELTTLVYDLDVLTTQPIPWASRVVRIFSFTPTTSE